LFVAATGHSFEALLSLSGSKDVFSQPLVLFRGHIKPITCDNLENIAPYIDDEHDALRDEQRANLSLERAWLSAQKDNKKLSYRR